MLDASTPRAFAPHVGIAHVVALTGAGEQRRKGGKTPWPTNVAAGRKLTGPLKVLRFRGANAMVFGMRSAVLLSVSHENCACNGATSPLSSRVVH